MKKQITLASISAVLAALLIFSLSTCKKDTAAESTTFTGKWANTIFSHTNLIGRYEFKSNDSVEYYSYQIDTVTQKILGYNYRTIGTYKLDNNTLTITNLTIFANPTNSFGPVAALLPIGSPEISTSTYTITIKKQSNRFVLSMYFTCPPYADCIPSPLVYYKQ